jgi:hypothetical protein
MFQQNIYDEFCKLIQNGEDIRKSALNVAKRHNTTPSRILKWYYSERPPSAQHMNSTLSNEQEEQLYYAAQAMSRVNLDWSVQQVKEAVKTMFDIEISLTTAWRFLRKYKNEFHFEEGTSLGKKRVEKDLFEKAYEFAHQFEHFIEQKKLPLKAFVNYDECRIVLSDKNIVQVRRLVSKKKNKPQSILKVKGIHCGTYIPFVSANGELIASYVILSMKFDENGETNAPLLLPSTFSRTRNGPIPPVLFFNETGYLNTEIFHQILDHFIGVWKISNSGLHCCLLGDNLAVHRDLQIIHKSLKSGIFMTYFIAGTTHWSQPLDNLLFARLKQEINFEACHITLLQVFTDDTLFSLIDLIISAAQRAFTWQAITHAFRETGVAPFSKQKMIDLAFINHNPSHSTYIPTQRDEYIIQQVVGGLQKCLSEVRDQVKVQSSKVTTVRVRVKKNVQYFAEDILIENAKQKIEEERARKEKKEEKEKK